MLELKKIGNSNSLIALAVIIVVMALAGIYLTANGAQSLTAQNGDTVSVYYTLSFTNGTVFQSNFGHQPFNFTMGANEVIPGFNQAVIGMMVNQTKNVTIPSNDAYGPVNPALFLSTSTNTLETEINATPTVGMTLTTSSGEHGIVTSANATNVTVDFNNPLAGKTLVFKIMLMSIKRG